MNKIIRVASAAIILAVAGAAQAQAQDKNNEMSCQDDKLVKSGTYTHTIENIGIILGGSWGNGTLTLANGKQYKYKLAGASTLDVGYSSATMEGTIYNLDKIEDFPGIFSGLGGGLTAGKGIIDGDSFTNEKCVVMDGSSKSSEGLRIKSPIGPQGIKVTFIE